MARLPKADMNVPMEMPPRVCVRVPYKEMKGLEMDDKVTITLTGKVIGMETYDKETGSIDLDNPDVKVSMKAKKPNEMSELADDEPV